MVARWLLLGVGTLAAVGAAPSTEGPKPDLAGYEAVKASAGPDASAQVKVALWCEAHGLPAERARHLALAVLTDPTNARARGLLGLVEYRGHWRRPEAVAERVKADEALTAKLAEYNARRSRTRDTADAHHKLALWCEQNGLKAEAVAHLTIVTRLDPGNESAWKRLGYKKHGHRRVTDAQLAAEKADADAQKKADRYWEPLLTKWSGWLGDRTRRAAAEEALAGVTDPLAIPSVWSVLVAGGPAHRGMAVQVLGRLEAPGSSRGLALLAAFDADPEVRRAAAETLRGRDPREFGATLVSLIRDPLKYQVRPVGGPGSPGALFVEGERFNLQRNYGAPALPQQFRVFGSSVPFDPFSPQNIAGANAVLQAGAAPDLTGRINLGPPGGFQRFSGAVARDPDGVVRAFTDQARLRDLQIGMNVVAVQTAAAESEGRLEQDVAQLDAENRAIAETNTRVVTVLRQVSGADLTEDRTAWIGWLADQAGYAPPSSESSPKPTFVQDVTPSQPLLNPAASSPIQLTSHSCFGAGTAVRTLEGPRPIESIQVGDRILTQDGVTGQLTYQPVVAVYHNPPNQTFRVSIGGESVVATGIHRFWKSGRGWAMTHDLKPGDHLRILDGVRTVESVAADRVQPVFNLQVADGQSFLVGASGLLVHDNSVVNPVAHPFDASPDLAAVAPTGR